MAAIVDAWAEYQLWRARAFAWRRQMPLAAGIALSFLAAVVTGALAQVHLPLPFTPVPVTGQTLGVYVCGALLGAGYGGLGQAIYVLLGAAGLRWFAGLSGGASVLSGVTGGYLVGFVLAAAFIGWASDWRAQSRRLLPQVLIMLAGGAIILLCGAVQLAIVLRVGFREAMLLGVLPFVPGELAKAALAAHISAGLLPKGCDECVSRAHGR